MEEPMFDKQFVTTAEEIKEAREALIQLGKDIAVRKMDTEFNEAQIVFANANARMELAPPGDDEANKAAEVANRRLLALFQNGWKRDEGLLFHCYRDTKSASATTPGRRLMVSRMNGFSVNYSAFPIASIDFRRSFRRSFLTNGLWKKRSTAVLNNTGSS